MEIDKNALILVKSGHLNFNILVNQIEGFA